MPGGDAGRSPPAKDGTGGTCACPSALARSRVAQALLTMATYRAPTAAGLLSLLRERYGTAQRKGRAVPQERTAAEVQLEAETSQWGRPGDHHRVSRPASMTNWEPVTNRARSDARLRTASATSSGSIQGTGSRLPAERSAISSGVAPSRAARPSFIGVFTPVG